MSNYLAVQLLTNAAATGAAVKWPGGSGTLFARATAWAAATLALEVNTNNDAGAAVWGPLTGVSLTADGAVAFSLPPSDIRAAITGGPPTAVFAHAVRINP